MPASHRGSMASSRDDGEHSQARYLDELEGFEVTEELSGFNSSSDDGGGGGRGGGGGQQGPGGNLLNVGDTMSDIGRVVSQTEAGMDFTTNLEAPMEGVQRRAVGGGVSARSSVSGRDGYSRGGGAGLGLVNGKPSPYEDMSMSRLADSYWRPDHHAGSSSDNAHTRDDLVSMEFSTQSAAAPVAVAGSSLARGGGGGGGGEEGETASDSFLVHASYGGSQHQHRLGSFYSDSHYQQQRPVSAESSGSRPLPRRPESYHDGPSTSSHQQQQQLPTFSSTYDSHSALAPAPAAVHSETANVRLARLVARYSNDPQQQRMAAGNVNGNGRGDRGYYGESSERPGGIRDISSEALSDDGMLPALPDTPDVHTAFTSIGHFSSMHSDAPAPTNAGGRSAMALDPSIVERTRTALQQRIASSESPGSDRAARQVNGAVDGGQSYSEMRERFLGGGSGGGSQQQQQQQQAAANHRRMVSVGNQSVESLDHPNLGSQGSMSPGHSSLLSMGDGGETGYYGASRRAEEDADARFMRPIDGISDSDSEEEEFGARRINSFGHSSSNAGHGATGELFNPVEDADELFGDHFTNSSSSNPDFSDIMRDHERVFSDLFDSSSSDSENGKEAGPHDSTEAPASLFASSSSIVAEISRRQAHARGITMKKKGKLSTWDGREATPDAMRRQERMFGVHTRNPIEMQGKVNSLGLEDHASDVSGLLPESEHSPRSRREVESPPARRVRSNTGVSLAQLGRNYRPPPPQLSAAVSAFPMTPQSAPLQNGAFDAPPPTTPTTFISRDTRHGPSTRVLHQVPPFDPLSPPNGLQQQQQQPTPDTLKFREESARGTTAPLQKRPAGPRSIDQSIGRSTVKSRPPMLDIIRQATPDQRRNARAAAQFAQAAAGSVQPAPTTNAKAVVSGGRDGAASPSDVSSHGLGSLFMDSLPVLDASRIGRSGGGQAAVATPPPFHALSRILNNTGGHTPRSSTAASATANSPLRSGGQTGIITSSSGNSSMHNTAAYVPFQDPTVDISNLPKYQDVDLKHHQHQRDNGGGNNARQSPYRQQIPPDSAVSNLYSATPSEIRDVTSAHGSFAFRNYHQRRISPYGYDDGGASDLVPTVKYDSPTPPTGPLTASMESLSLSDIGMDEDISVRNSDMRSVRQVAVGHGSNHRSSHGAAHAAVREGPTLRDIYDLLKKTVSSIDAQQQQTARPHGEDISLAQDAEEEEEEEEDRFDGSSMHVVPRQLQSQVPEYHRPAAPTPRRSRHFPTQYRDTNSESEDGGMVDESRVRGRSDTGQSRVRAYLQRYMSESAIGAQRSYAAQNNTGPTPAAAENIGHHHQQQRGEEEEVAVAVEGAERILVDLLSFVSGEGGGGVHIDPDLHSVLGRKLPPALAEKLRELAGVLAQATAAAGNVKHPASKAEEKKAPPAVVPPAPVADEAIQTDDAQPPIKGGEDMGLRTELLRLQREILDKFDEYRAEVDQLRSEVRRTSTPIRASSPSPSFSSSVAPHDSVSVVAEAAGHMTTSPRPASSVRPMYTVPTTARNRQRHMVQWLGRQQTSEHAALPFTTPTKPASRVDERHQQSPLNGSSGARRRSSHRRAATVEDADDHDAGLGAPKRMAADNDGDDDDDALSDTSTTVPDDRMPTAMMRGPVDPATIMGSTRKTRHRAVSPWDGHEDLLATREALDSIRGKQQQQLSGKQAGAEDDGSGFARQVYGREMAQQLGATLAELQRVHAAQFHGPRSVVPCPVCRALEAQNYDPYLFGRRAIAYRSMSTRQLQGLLNAYVAAMQDHQQHNHRHHHQRWEPTTPARTSFTPSRANNTPKKGEAVVVGEPRATKVIGLLRDELDALSRRYHRLVDEFHRLDPSREADQRRRRIMSRELKDLVDVLDVKGEQIAILASLHPEATATTATGQPPSPSANMPGKSGGGLSSTQRALQSARELQNALGDLY